MSSLPYFNMYPTDFEAKTSHLSLEEDGAYNRLLRLIWMSPDCTLPDDDKWIMRRMRTSEDDYRRVVLVVIDEFFTRANGRLSNARMTEEFLKSSEAHKNRVLAGKKGGKAKSLNNKDLRSSNAKAKLKQPEPEPEPEPIKISCPSDTRHLKQIQESIDLFNLKAKSNDWPLAQNLTDKRKSAFKKRLQECDGIEGWKIALEKAEASDFLNNRTKTNFTNSLDFMLQASSFTKLMEGNYDNRDNKTISNGGANSAHEKLARGFAKTAAKYDEAERTGINPDKIPI